MAEESKDKKPRQKMVGANEEKEQINRKLVVWVLIGVMMVGIVVVLLGGKSIPTEMLPGLGVVEETIKSKQVTPTPVKRSYQKITDELKELVASQAGEYAVGVKHINGGDEYGFGWETEMEGASIMKVPAMLTLVGKIQAGELSASGTSKLLEADRSPGAGPLQYLAAGTEVSWERILVEMGQKSDNTGWRMLNREVGKENIKAEMGRWGMTGSVYEDGVYTTTLRDVVKLFGKVAQTPEIFKYLRDSIYEDRISKGVPVGVEVVHKVGTLPGVWEDAGIVRCPTKKSCGVDPFIVVILNKGIKQAEAEVMVPEIVKRIWKFEAGSLTG